MRNGVLGDRHEPRPNPLTAPFSEALLKQGLDAIEHPRHAGTPTAVEVTAFYALALLEAVDLTDSGRIPTIRAFSTI